MDDESEESESEPERTPAPDQEQGAEPGLSLGLGGEPQKPSVAAAMPVPMRGDCDSDSESDSASDDDGWISIEAGTNIGTAVVAEAVLEDRGFDATLIEAGSQESTTETKAHMIRVPAKDEAEVTAIILEVQAAS